MYYEINFVNYKVHTDFQRKSVIILLCIE